MIKGPAAFHKAAFLWGAGICALAFGGLAGTVDTPKFEVPGLVVVRGADGSGNAPIVSDFIVERGGVSNDLIVGDTYTVVTGTLDPLNEAFPDGAGAALRIQNARSGGNQTTLQGDRFTGPDDILNPIGLRANTDVRTIRSEIESSFYVASNKAFNIDVVASSLGDPSDLNLIRLRMRLDRTGTDSGLSYGAAAQLPHTGNSTTSGLQWTGYRRLSSLTTSRSIFEGNRRTAASAGTIPDQSVRFDLDYRWNTGNIDLADGTFDVEAEVVYTVYIP